MNEPLHRRLAPYLIAIVIAVAFFALVEKVRPYYFFQDDNRDIFVPLYLHNYRAAADGQLAQYNFFQSLGRPHFGSGQVAALQPVNYLAIFLSYKVLGHPFATADIYLLLYLLMGVCGAVFLARLLGFSNTAAVFASVAWAYTPFNMLVSQSWTTYPPVIGTLPWILASALLVYRGRRVLGGWIFVLSHLVLIYVGAPQFVLYAGYAEAGLIVFVGFTDYAMKRLSNADAKRTAIAFALLVAVVAGLSMPLVYPMWKHTQLSAFRSGRLGDGALRVCSIQPMQLVNGLFVPQTRFYKGSGGEWCGTNFPASFVHQGYLVTLLVFAYPWLRRKLREDQRVACDAAMATGVILALAMMGWLTHFVAMIPVANRMRWPFKYFGFANLLFVVVATASFEVLLSRFRATLRTAAGVLLIALQMVNVTALDLSFPDQAFFEHLDPVPLQEPLKEKLGAGRILTMGWKGGAKRHTLYTIGYDYATLWELHYFGGYDPLVPSRNLQFTYTLDYTAIINRHPKNIRFDYLRFWGVRWYVVTPYFRDMYVPALEARGFRLAFKDPQREVFEDPLAEPIVGSPDCRTLSIGRLGDDLTAILDCARDAEVRLRFLSHPYFTATIDGTPVEITTKASSQMTIPVPRGRHRMQLAYDDPAIDIGMSIGLMTVAAAAAYLVLRRRRTDVVSR